MDFKYFGLIALCILVFGLVFVIFRWPHPTRATFSQHVAARRSSILYYALLFSIVLPLLLLFFMGWFVPHFNVSIWFSVFVVLSSVAQLACTFIPETGGWKTKVHRFLAGFSGICLLPALGVLLISNSTDTSEKLMTGLSIAVMAGIVVSLAMHTQHAASYIHQAMYYFAFFLPILVMSYL